MEYCFCWEINNNLLQKFKIIVVTLICICSIFEKGFISRWIKNITLRREELFTNKTCVTHSLQRTVQYLLIMMNLNSLFKPEINVVSGEYESQSMETDADGFSDEYNLSLLEALSLHCVHFHCDFKELQLYNPPNTHTGPTHLVLTCEQVI